MARTRAGAPAYVVADHLRHIAITDAGAPRERVLTWMACLRALGVSADTDYAGRSLKGQLTQAARLCAIL